MLLRDPKAWVDFGNIVNCPGWDFLQTLKKLSPKQRYCILALAQQATTQKELEDQAGLFGKPGLNKDVKLFWRNMAYKVITEAPYISAYRAELDRQFKRNQSSSTPLQLSHLKFRARTCALAVFLGELRSAITKGEPQWSD